MHLPSSLLAFAYAHLLQVVVAADQATPPPTNESLLWGPYRPNLYMGIRPRRPDSLIAGLMWGKFEDVEKTLRHDVAVSDGMAKYGYTTYDPRHGGQQIIEDEGNKVDITTEFTKPSDDHGTGNWALRVKGVPRNGAPAGLKTTVVFYVGMEAMETCSECQLEAQELVGEGEDKRIHAVSLHIKHPKSGDADVQILKPKGSHGEGEIVVKSLNVSEGNLWKAKSIFLTTLKNHMIEGTEAGSVDLVLRNDPGIGNIHMVQLVCHGTFEFDVLYSSRAEARAMTSAELTRSLETSTELFHQNFAKVFAPHKPFKTEQHLRFSEAVFSNLLAGLGYFRGTTKVDASKKAIYAETTGKFWEKSEEARKHATPETKGPYELLTFTPSRSAFPRGFLWDEGFHLLAVLEWDADLALEVLQSWLALMDADGWIAREQILGEEAEGSTPPEFVTQFPHIANPPTMFMVVSRFVKMLEGKTKYFGRESMYLTQPDSGKALLAEVYSKLQKHYEWFRISQAGDVEVHSIPSANLNEGYRWRGRTPETNFASGLDDYPRAEPPDISELHLDALCWVGVMARTLSYIASFTQSTRDISTYQNHVRNVKKNIDTIHWEEREHIYCDTVVRNDIHTFACHKGYISLFPFLTGLLEPNHHHLPFILDLLNDPNQLWTIHGIRSLSPEDKRYGVADNYWRSPIWININYLAIEQVFHLATSLGPLQQRSREIYTQLRSNIVHTVYSSWVETGFVWEQYDPVGGHGQRTQHFTGWTALVVKIMAMPDLAHGDSVKEKVEEYYEEAKKQAVGYPRTSGAGSLALVVMVMVFLYVTRRRFAGTLRGWRVNR
ncbi:glycoside hydrolase family 63 protein [Plenodomus tracheiphilus IPT5]|uniref:Mannosyl-oligosaccharide glucosidase n=1 Tax=Plenodomus tracheiphilus IPT5 TaxID=1408161 RepID=A0A6A7AVP9_9PLEO|nr:glycoside hydrolase family 63 protein [Plenodomus tracheiphilus IPT5]